RRERADDVRRVRDPQRDGAQPRPGVHARHAALARVGRLRVPRPAHDRRPHPASAREARGRPQGARVHLHGAWGRLPLPRRGIAVAITRPLRSLRNRLALIFAAIVLAAFGGIYVYVTPTLQERLIDQKLEDLTADAKRYSQPINDIAGTSVSTRTLQRRVQAAATRSSAEVTLLGLVAGADNMFLSFSDSDPGGATIGDMQSVAEE